MAVIHKILFPVDFSPACAAAAPFIEAVASACSADLTLLHVIRPFDFSAFELVGRPLAEIEQEQFDLARRRLNEFLAAALPPGKAARAVVSGDPAAQIVALAREGKFDLIAMPTYSGGLFRQTLLGSTTAKVLNDADCPVLTPGHAAAASPRPLGQREIACAIGLDVEGARVLRYAGEFARAVGARLSIIHSLPERHADVHGLFDAEQERATQAAQARLAEMQREAGTQAQVRLTTGPLLHAIVAATDELPFDLLVIGRGPVAGAVGRMRDLTYALIRDSHCWILSL